MYIKIYSRVDCDLIFNVQIYFCSIIVAVLHVYVRVCLHVWCVCVYMRVFVRAYVGGCACVHTYIRACLCVCSPICNHQPMIVLVAH